MSILSEISCFLSPLPEKDDVWARWMAIESERHIAYVDGIIREADAKRDALYVDPYNEAVSLYREYQLGVPA